LTSIVLVFEVHQPYRLRRQAYHKLLERALRGEVSTKDLEEVLFDNDLNKLVIERASTKCYIPATKIILENVMRYRDSSKPFKVSFSISGVFLEQVMRWKPEVVELFRKLVDTGMVELVEQTYYHSMVAFMPLQDWAELREQVWEHRRIIEEVFSYKPVSIENTEFSYNNDLACLFHSMGYRVVLTEGVDRVLGWRSPNYVYRAYGCDVRVLTRNYRLSDDVGFRFSDRSWDQYPLTADKYAAWLAATPGDVITLAMDYETFGEHHQPETGIHEFLKRLPGEVLKYEHLEFSTPSEAAYKYPARDVYDVPSWSSISWADERDLSAWLGNSMQQSAFNMIVSLRPYVQALNNPELKRIWKLLTTSDHLYYMATKHGSFEQVHEYFSPYKSAAEAYAVFVQAISILASYIAEEVERRRGEVLLKLTLPDNLAFHFNMPDGSYTGFSAHSIKELLEILDRVPKESLLYHWVRRDLQKWFSDVFGLHEVAEKLDRMLEMGVSVDELRHKLAHVIRHVAGGAVGCRG